MSVVAVNALLPKKNEIRLLLSAKLHFASHTIDTTYWRALATDSGDSSTSMGVFDSTRMPAVHMSIERPLRSAPRAMQ